MLTSTELKDLCPNNRGVNDAFLKAMRVYVDAVRLGDGQDLLYRLQALANAPDFPGALDELLTAVATATGRSQDDFSGDERKLLCDDVIFFGDVASTRVT